MQYVVHYWLDNVTRTPGRCRTDHPLKAGDIMYTQHGRATVRSCRPDQSTDATFTGKNARVLKSLA